MATQFNIKFNVSEDELQGKSVLVFLKPQNPQRDYRIHAWQVLNGTAGATEKFSYDGSITTDVSTLDINKQKISSDSARILPGQMLKAVSPTSLTPVLEAAPAALAQGKLTPQQCGVTNHTNPYIQFDSNWYVNDKPVVTMPYVDWNMTVSFEYEPNFYFMVATPPAAGQTYIVQNFADMTHYSLPPTATEVDVSVNRKQGLWNFDFSAS